MGVVNNKYIEMISTAMDCIDHGMDEMEVKGLLSGYYNCGQYIADEVYQEAFMDVCQYHNDMKQMYSYEEQGQ